MNDMGVWEQRYNAQISKRKKETEIRFISNKLFNNLSSIAYIAFQIKVFFLFRFCTQSFLYYTFLLKTSYQILLNAWNTFEFHTVSISRKCLTVKKCRKRDNEEKKSCFLDGWTWYIFFKLGVIHFESFESVMYESCAEHEIKTNEHICLWASKYEKARKC